MGTARFERNAEVRFDGRTHVLTRLVDAITWQLEDTRTKRITEKTIPELQTLYLNGALIFEPPAGRPAVAPRLAELGKAHTEISKEQFDKAKLKRLYVKALQDVPASNRFIREAIQKLWQKIKQPATAPHPATVRRWRSCLVAAGGDIRAVVDKISQRGNRTARYPEMVTDIVENAIDVVYLTLERKTVQDTLDRACVDVIRENKLRPDADKLPLPTLQLVKRKINEIPAFDRCVAREGRMAAVRRFRSVKRHRTTQFPLERCEIDHTLLDLMVLDDRTGLPLGRPVMTVCIDDNTRCVLGINIGFEPPSLLTVARCLKHAFLPKTRLKEEHPEIVNDWLAHGVAGEASVDNGLEFHGIGLEQAALELGMEIHYSPRKKPWHKGKIERFLKTLNFEVAHGVPGTTFSNIFEKDDYDPLKHAVIRLSVLKKVVMMWIADVYHQRPHRALKVPPAVAWSSRIRPEDIGLPEDPERLDAVLGRRLARTLTHKGIEFEGLFYNSPELAKLRMQLGDRLEVEISVNDGDIGSLVVFSPDKTRMFTALALNQAYANGLTAWQHKVCKRFAAREMSQYGSSGWLEAKERIAELIRDEFAQKKARSRSRIGRFQEGQVPSASSAPKPPGRSVPPPPPKPSAPPPAASQAVTAPAIPVTNS
ncbi:Mu transposase C-terminal domain-containing protein, partial [Roseateles sp. P5_E11]